MLFALPPPAPCCGCGHHQFPGPPQGAGAALAESEKAARAMSWDWEKCMVATRDCGEIDKVSTLPRQGKEADSTSSRRPGTSNVFYIPDTVQYSTVNSSSTASDMDVIQASALREHSSCCTLVPACACERWPLCLDRCLRAALKESDVLVMTGAQTSSVWAEPASRSSLHQY
nr:hypothetical protein CFP56_70785 [Quercus suber]